MNATIRGNAWPDAYGESLGLVIIRKAGDYRERDVGFRIAKHVDRSRVFRGSGWSDIVRLCRLVYREYDEPGKRHSSLGFRVSRRKP